MLLTTKGGKSYRYTPSQQPPLLLLHLFPPSLSMFISGCSIPHSCHTLCLHSSFCDALDAAPAPSNSHDSDPHRKNFARDELTPLIPHFSGPVPPAPCVGGVSKVSWHHAFDSQHNTTIHLSKQPSPSGFHQNHWRFCPANVRGTMSSRQKLSFFF